MGKHILFINSTQGHNKPIIEKYNKIWFRSSWEFLSCNVRAFVYFVIFMKLLFNEILVLNNGL